MENKNEFDDNSQNDINEESELEESFDENDDSDALKEKFEKISEQNKQLFARAKKAEGFELKDGKWVKPEKSKKIEQDKSESDTKPPKGTQQSSDLDYGQLALLRTEGIKGSGEIALFKEIMSETGKGVLDVLDSNYFKSRLTDFRDAQESANSVPKGNKRTGQQGATDVDIAIAKYKDGGELPSDFKTRSAVIKAIEAEEQSSGMFEGPAVVGPRRQ